MRYRLQANCYGYLPRHTFKVIGTLDRPLSPESHRDLRADLDHESVASLELCASPMNSLSCQRGMP